MGVWICQSRWWAHKEVMAARVWEAQLPAGVHAAPGICQGLGSCWRPGPAVGSRSQLLGQAQLLQFQPWITAQAEAPCEEQGAAREKTHSVHAPLKACEQQQDQKSEMLRESMRFLGVMSHFCIEAAEFDLLYFFFSVVHCEVKGGKQQNNLWLSYQAAFRRFCQEQ